MKKADKGTTLWVYRADPAVCTGLYVGDQQAYAIYLRKAAEKPPVIDGVQGGGAGGDWDFSAWADDPSPHLRLQRCRWGSRLFEPKSA